MKQKLAFLIIFVGITSNAQEIIPFELKKDNRIYIKVKINESENLDFIYDLGADATVINKTKLKEKNVKIDFDQTILNQGTHGTSEVDLSTGNMLQVGKTQKKRVKIVGIAYSESEIFDGVIGWNFFKDKIVRINYETKELVIYDEYDLTEGYTANKIKFINNLFFLQFTIYKKNRKVKIWGELDTGYDGALYVYYPASVKYKLLNHYQVIGESTISGTDGKVAKADYVLIPKTELGGFQLYNLPASITKTNMDAPHDALIGGNLLKKFDVVIDFRRRMAYFKPNGDIHCML